MSLRNIPKFVTYIPQESDEHTRALCCASIKLGFQLIPEEYHKSLLKGLKSGYRPITSLISLFRSLEENKTIDLHKVAHDLGKNAHTTFKVKISSLPPVNSEGSGICQTLKHVAKVTSDGNFALGWLLLNHDFSSDLGYGDFPDDCECLSVYYILKKYIETGVVDIGREITIPNLREYFTSSFKDKAKEINDFIKSATFDMVFNRKKKEEEPVEKQSKDTEITTDAEEISQDLKENTPDEEKNSGSQSDIEKVSIPKEEYEAFKDFQKNKDKPTNYKSSVKSKVRIIETADPQYSDLELDSDPLYDNNYRKLLGVLQVVVRQKSVFYNFYPILEWMGKGYRIISIEEAKRTYSQDDGSITLDGSQIADTKKRLDNLGNGSLINITFETEDLEQDPFYTSRLNINAKALFKNGQICRADRDSNHENKACFVVDCASIDDFISPNITSKRIVTFRKFEKAQEYKFNKNLVCVPGKNGYFGPYPVVCTNTGEYYCDPLAHENSPTGSYVDGLSKINITSVSAYLDLSLPYVCSPILLLGRQYVKNYLYDNLSDDDLISYAGDFFMNHQTDDFEIKDIDKQIKDVFYSKTEEFAQSRKDRLRALNESILDLNNYAQYIQNIFKSSIASDKNFILKVAKSISSDTEIVEQLSKTKALTIVGEKAYTQAQELENKKLELQSSIEEREGVLKQVEEQLCDHKELLDSYTSIALAKEENERLKKENAKIRENIENSKKNFEEFDGGITRYEERIKSTAELVASLSFDEAITSKIMDASNTCIENTEASLRQKKFDIISNIELNDKTGKPLVKDLIEQLEKLRSYGNNGVEYVNLLSCVSLGFLTVISGAPGSGKTSLCNLLAQSLGLTSINSLLGKSSPWKESDLANRYLQVSVERGWNSKRDFIGYFNPLTRTFESTDPQRIECFRQLNKEAIEHYDSLPYFVLLDEANLSPMEYYFADFMNICDKRDINSTLSLSGTQRYRIPDSLRFLATINNDHTTDRLSPRLLDRSWIIVLPESKISPESDSSKLYTPINFNNLKEAFNPQGKSYTQAAGELSEISRILSPLNIQLSIRSQKAILNYVNGTSMYFEGLSQHSGFTTAFDFAVAQKALPFIDVLGEQYREHLENALNFFREHSYFRCENIISRILNNGGDMDDYRFFKF